VVAFVFLAFELIYYFAPDLNTKQLRWLAPGAMTGVVLWLLVSFLFGSYLNFYNNYSVVYCSLAAVIILMLWFYLTGVTILIGGEVNAIIEQAAARLTQAAAIGIAAGVLLAAWGIFIKMNKSAEELEPEAMAEAKSKDRNMKE
jgi:uncharacterized BrkB/YihY/UPF0761 family membrane protein